MTISVIIPFYEGNKYLPQINSMISANAVSIHKKADVELVLVNDSPWREVQIDFVKSKQYKMKLVVNQSNLGIHGSRVQGLRNASGQYVLMLDQDDRISKDCLYRHLETIGQADVSVSNGYKYKDGKKTKIYGTLRQQEKVKNEFLYLYLENRIMSPGQCLIRKECIPKSWCDLIMHKNGADDMLLWVMMLEAKNNFKVLPYCLYMHVFTGKNVSADDLKMADSTYEMLNILHGNSLLSTKKQKILQRKIENDIYYVKTGKDRFWDYKLIEMVRKILHRSR